MHAVNAPQGVSPKSVLMIAGVSGWVTRSAELSQAAWARIAESRIMDR
jgi:hypothetical protein